ncbi:MAG TPA: putative collagen-binding domain-containing protein, partial [Candidatus Binatia bacterium]|nr:putative collagen-binding domain-containing protein [Candidatus Binatia bacterium]
WLLVPDLNNTVVTSCTPNCGTALAYTLVVAARTSDGQTIMVYIPDGSATTISVNLARISSSTSAVHGWWFNPRTGATNDLGTFANSGTMMFTPPDSDDWVLVLDDAGAALPAPGTAVF